VPWRHVTRLANREIAHGGWGLGHKAGVFDAELLALARSATRLSTLIPNLPPVTKITFLADNQSALKSVLNLSPHPGQLLSALYRKHIDTLLANSPSLVIMLAWVPGHSNIAGNTWADSLACQATSFPSIIHSTTVTCKTVPMFGTFAVYTIYCLSVWESDLVLVGSSEVHPPG